MYVNVCMYVNVNTYVYLIIFQIIAQGVHGIVNFLKARCPDPGERERVRERERERERVCVCVCVSVTEERRALFSHTFANQLLQFQYL